MSDFTLHAETPLGGFRRGYDGITLREIGNRALVSLAVPQGGDAAFEEALKNAYGLDRPAVGSSSLTGDGGVRLLGMQPDQMFLLFDTDHPWPDREVAEKLAGAAYVTDQSDSWVMLRISGPRCRAALERICMLDLDDAAFPEGRVARTVMEHLATIILRDDPDSFLLLSPRSSAQSFLHAVETSIHNIL